MQPDTHYARTHDGISIAYQVVGDGDKDLVLVPGWVFHVEVAWEHPSFEAFMRRLTRSFRVILFDKRGTGLSDRIGASALEERMDDVRAVMDAVGCENASLMGWSEGANIAALFAASYPDRVEGLVLYGGGARYRQAPDYPIGMSDDFIAAAKDVLRSSWGQGVGAYFVAPSRADDESFRRWFARFERMTVSPGGAEAMVDVNLEIDTTEMLRSVTQPTLVLHNSQDAFVPVEFGRYIADQVPDAKLVELEGSDHLFWFCNPEEVVGELEDFLVGVRAVSQPERVLSTVLVTDIVGSTERAREVGDARWREILDIHDRLARSTIASFRGDLIKTLGDGVLATFDGPARAVQCAQKLRSGLSDSGLEVRAGIHTGEIEMRNGDIGGIGVHIAARIAGLAAPGEVLTSRTVKDLSAGAGITFVDKGSHEIDGLDESWNVFAASL